jgi:hypothetical protein
LLCLKLEQLGVGRLPLTHRRRIYRTILTQPELPQVKQSEAVVIEVCKARTDLSAAMDRYQRAEAMVIKNPKETPAGLVLEV